jgi:adenylosuccinate synthase
MSSIAVLGSAWGDEAKAKIVDVLASDADIIIRFQGGNNAGHTIVIDDQKYVFHLVPAGILYPEKICVLSGGVVIDPDQLIVEMEELKKRNITFEGRFFIDPRAGIVLALHKKLDSISEADSEKIKIGTTKRGIGPCYSDLIARVGIRMSDLLQEELLRKKIKNLFHYHKTELENFEEQVESLLRAGEYFKPFLTQVPYYLESNKNKNLLFEGAQGSLLDVIFGTYPFVTSSHTIAGGISAGSGYSPRNIEKIIGVYKSYYTRVGEGPFPTELFNDTGDQIRKQGNEYGATTGRPRRCGWFDAIAARYTAIINGIDEVALTLLDVLTGISELKICTGYLYKNEIIKQFPENISVLEDIEPVYFSLPGWKEDITGIKRFDDLPKNAKTYVAKIEEILNKKVSMISVGPDRSQTIFRTA